MTQKSAFQFAITPGDIAGAMGGEERWSRNKSDGAAKLLLFARVYDMRKIREPWTFYDEIVSTGNNLG